MPSGSHSYKKQPAISNDSDYDVEGVGNGVGNGAGSVSSKDGRGNQLLDVEPLAYVRNGASNSIQEKEQVEKQPRRRRSGSNSNCVNKQPGPSHDENLHMLSRNNVPDMNKTEIPLVEYQMHGTQQENDTSTALRPAAKSFEVQSHLPASEYNHYPTIASTNAISTPNMYVEERSMRYPLVQRAELPHEASYDFYNQPVEYGPGYHSQHTQMEISVPQIKAGANGIHSPSLGRNENDVIGGDANHFAKDMFHNEQVSLLIIPLAQQPVACRCLEDLVVAHLILDLMVQLRTLCLMRA